MAHIRTPVLAGMEENNLPVDSWRRFGIGGENIDTEKFMSVSSDSVEIRSFFSFLSLSLCLSHPLHGWATAFLKHFHFHRSLDWRATGENLRK